MSDYRVALLDGRTVVVDARDENEARNAARNFRMRETAGRRGGAEGGVDDLVPQRALENRPPATPQQANPEE